MIEYRRIVGAKRCWWCDAIVDDGGRFCPWTMPCMKLWTEREAKWWREMAAAAVPMPHPFAEKGDKQ